MGWRGDWPARVGVTWVSREHGETGNRDVASVAGPRWAWALGVVALGVLAFLAVNGPYRLVTVVGVVLALLALLRRPVARR